MKVFGVFLDGKYGQTEEALSVFTINRRKLTLEKLKLNEHKNLSLYAELMLKYTVSTNLGIPFQKLKFDMRPGEKPRILNHPEIDVSYSHTSGFVLCAISDDGQIGVDVERLRKAPFKVMKKAFNEKEIDYVQNHNDEIDGDGITDADIRFFEIWTKKEAYAKCTGKGLSIGLKKIDTLPSEQLSTGYFDSYIYKRYLCSIFCTSAIQPEMIIIKQDDIKNFFLS